MGKKTLPLIEEDYGGCQYFNCPWCGAYSPRRCHKTGRKGGGRHYPHKEREKVYARWLQRKAAYKERLKDSLVPVCTCEGCRGQNLSLQGEILPFPINDDGTFGDPRIDDLINRVNPPGYALTEAYWNDPHERARRAHAKLMMKYDSGMGPKPRLYSAGGGGRWLSSGSKIVPTVNLTYGSEPTAVVHDSNNHLWTYLTNGRTLPKFPSENFDDEPRVGSNWFIHTTMREGNNRFWWNT